MAVPTQRDPELDALLHKGAAEITQLNPHLGAQTPAYSDEECAAILRDDEDLERLWNSPEGRKAQQLGYSASDAVDEDRGNR